MFYVCFFFFNDTATTEIYTLSLHDALPICERRVQERDLGPIAQLGHEALRVLPEVVEAVAGAILDEEVDAAGDRKSTRLNSSHDQISYAVFCLKKKNNLPIM